jgi:integrase
LVTRELADTTAATYEQMARTHLLPRLGDRRLSKLRGSDLSALYRELRAGGLSAATVARLHAVVSGCLRAAVKDELLLRNPASNAVLPRREQPRVEPWSPEQVGRFLDATQGHRLYPLFMAGAHTGLRRGELLGLQWRDVDLVGARLSVARQRVPLWSPGGSGVVVHEGTKTKAGVRVVWLDLPTVGVLRRWKRQQLQERLALGEDYCDPGMWVFTREDGQPYLPEFVTRTFSRLARRHGLPPAKLHSLRHFRASALIAAGEEITVVAKLLGHSSVRVTADTYGHLLEVRGREATERAGRLVPRQTAG